MQPRQKLEVTLGISNLFILNTKKERKHKQTTEAKKVHYLLQNLILCFRFLQVGKLYFKFVICISTIPKLVFNKIKKNLDTKAKMEHRQIILLGFRIKLSNVFL